VHSGVLGGEWLHPDRQDAGLELAVVEQDLGGIITLDELARCRAIDRSARKSGERVQFVPTFYAHGQKGE
jgi:hypothetical protein